MLPGRTSKRMYRGPAGDGAGVGGGVCFALSSRALYDMRGRVFLKARPPASLKTTSSGSFADPVSRLYSYVRTSRSCLVEALWYGITRSAAYRLTGSPLTSTT